MEQRAAAYTDGGAPRRVVIAEDDALLREGLVLLLGNEGDRRRGRGRGTPAHPTAAGGVGYLLKERVGKVATFLDALRRVVDGGTVLDPEVVSQLMVRRRADDPMRALTPREQEVLALMAEGYANSAIAEQLVVSETAVSKHIGNIFAKLGLSPTDTGHRRVLAVLAHLRS
jgi:DNA-binding NarL/FixJ family response regulator